MNKLAGLWENKYKTTKSGQPSKVLLRGSINAYTDVIITINQNKQSDKSPDAWLFLAEKQKKEDQPQQGQPLPTAPQFNENDIPL